MMTLSFEWVTTGTSVARAEAGCLFDGRSAIYQQSYAPRFAAMIQEARDKKDYTTSDMIRRLAGACGMRVRMERDATVIFGYRDIVPFAEIKRMAD